MTLSRLSKMLGIDKMRFFLFSEFIMFERPASLPLACLGAACLSACAVGPDYAAPDLARIADETPGVISPASLDGEPLDDALLAEWWRTFDDPALDAAVDIALAQNFTLSEAIARISQARGVLKQSRAALGPGGGATGAAGSRQGSLEVETGALFRQGLAPRETEFYEIGLDAAWELDFFGGRRRAAESARAQTEAAIEGAMAARSSVAAETVRVYLEIRALTARIAVAERAIASARELRDLTALRVGNGLSPRLDLLQAEALLSGSQAALPPLRAARVQALNAYDLILGGVPGEYSPALELDEAFLIRAPMSDVAAAPVSILARRPDLRAAERVYAATNANIGVAQAGFFPRITLGGAIGYAALDTGDLVGPDAVQYAAGPAVSWRIFDWFRIRGELEAAKGRRREALIAYEQAAYRAVADLENAVARLSAGAEAIRHLDANARSLRETRDVARIAYERGAQSFLQVLDAQRALDAAEDRVIAARLNETLAAIAAFQALGGGWSETDRAAAVTLAIGVARE